MRVRTLAVCFCLVTTPGLAARATPEDEKLRSEELRASPASSSDHLAQYSDLGELIKAAQNDVNIHRQMELAYRRIGPPAHAMVEHCHALIASDKQIIQEYEAMMDTSNRSSTTRDREGDKK